ncbi:phospholipase A1 [Acinetobacter calcoaceticus]|uniref:Phospholipase A1 n=1 Tax=Acinetobacter calcoaceticus TaxID=471 RepID=A0A4R1XUZ8_ACICA|nr:phospholipase A1 [Acinetobacter calcoaceticus]
MSCNAFERTTLNLSVFSILSFGGASIALAAETASMNPSSAQACAALESNADRLDCYDTLFKVREEQREVLVSERQAAKTIEVPLKTEPQGIKATITEKIDSLFAVEGPRFDPNTSLLDKRWELGEGSKLGTWNIRSHQPVYLLPVFWTSDKNSMPSSPNPDNTVSLNDKQILKSTESKFQISLKTKAVENLFGDNGDVWLGYTQSSRWQVYNAHESRPFRETNYEPEASLMFRTNYEVLGLNGRLLGVTFNHQSNGRSDPLSRSWNRVMFNIGFEKDNFAVMLRPWYRIDEDAKDDNNPDIKDYMGRGDLTAFYRKDDHEFALMLRHSLKGGDRSNGAVQFDWSFPITGKLRGHFQLFDGYGESLIDYNHRATYAGLGISLMNWY